MGGGALRVRELPDQPYEVSALLAREVPKDGRPAQDEALPSATSGGIAAERSSAEMRSRPADDRDVDAIEALGEEVVTSFAHADVLTQRGLAALAEFDRLRGWELSGQPSAAHWLSARCRIDLGTARERVRAARALANLPLTRAAMASGQLSFCQVRALTRAATPDNEADLLTLARGAGVHQLERMIRAWRKGSRQDEAARERAVHEARTLSVFPDDEGGYLVRGRLTPEAGALLMRALEAASDALFHADPAFGTTDAERHREAGQRRADALVLLAERALAAGFGPPVDSAEAPISGTNAERYQVMLHVEPQTLSAEGEPGMSELEDGTRVACETSRRLTCDASVVPVARAPDSTVLDVGRRTRTIPPALRRALEIRDRGCRFPGCGRRFTHVHHVRHWAQGGETSLDNCLLLCGHHHRLVHEGGWRIGWGAERRPVFFDPRGHLHYDGGWQPPPIREETLAEHGGPS